MGEVHEEFDDDTYYVGFAKKCPRLFFCVVVHYRGGYMLILHPRDETYAILVWATRTLSQANMVTSSLHC